MLFALLVEACLYTKWGKRRCVDAGEKRRILNHAERRFSRHSGGDCHQAKNPSQPVSLPHLWVDVAQWGEGTPTALDFDFVLKLSDWWLTAGPLLFPITCFYDSTLKMIESHNSFMEHFSSLQQLLIVTSLWFLTQTGKLDVLGTLGVRWCCWDLGKT